MDERSQSVSPDFDQYLEVYVQEGNGPIIVAGSGVFVVLGDNCNVGPERVSREG